MLCNALNYKRKLPSTSTRVYGRSQILQMRFDLSFFSPLLFRFALLHSFNSVLFFFRQSLCLSTRNVWRPVIVVVVIVVGGDDDYDGMCDEIYRTFGGVCMRAWDFSSMVSFVRIVISAEVCNAYMPKANENKKNGNNLISFLFVFIVEEEREGETTRVSQQATYIHDVNTPRSSNCGCF